MPRRGMSSMPTSSILWRLAVAVAGAEVPLFDVVVVAWAPSSWSSPARVLDAPHLVAEARAPVLAGGGGAGDAGAEDLGDDVADAAAYAQLVDHVEEEEHCVLHMSFVMACSICAFVCVCVCLSLCCCGHGFHFQ